MAENQPPEQIHSPSREMIVHVACPECGSDKAVVAATHYGQQMCFCPACEHVWDCEAPV
jgi:hypothetical protein